MFQLSKQRKSRLVILYRLVRIDTNTYEMKDWTVLSNTKFHESDTRNRFAIEIGFEKIIATCTTINSMHLPLILQSHERFYFSKFHFLRLLCCNQVFVLIFSPSASRLFHEFLYNFPDNHLVLSFYQNGTISGKQYTKEFIKHTVLALFKQMTVKNLLYIFFSIPSSP